jgi:hypothetical protein
MGRFIQYQTGEAIKDAANNPSGGAAGVGAGLGAGMAMAEQMRGAMSAPAAAMAPGMAPPPLPSAGGFHVAIGGQQAGPFDLATLQRKVAAGEINRDTLVWKPGMAGWVTAAQVGEFASLLANVPPPLPPNG